MKTRKIRKKRGGFSSEDVQRVQASFSSKSDDIKNQIIHCISQLKRFSKCMYESGKEIKAYQLFYNLGRMQELLGETTKPTIWWTPIEDLAKDKKDLGAHIDTLKDLIGCQYDEKVLSKPC